MKSQSDEERKKLAEKYG
jgi:hypothetical protein